MTRPDPKRLAILAAALPLALAAPASADDPAAAEGRPAAAGAPVTPDLPKPDAVLDAMPRVIFPEDAERALRDAGEAPGDASRPGAVEETGTLELETPALGERPTPREALRADEIDDTIMRPRGGSATGGKPDVPPER